MLNKMTISIIVLIFDGSKQPSQDACLLRTLKALKKLLNMEIIKSYLNTLRLHYYFKHLLLKYIACGSEYHDFDSI